MDMNEVMNALSSNPQLAAQFVQMFQQQQNGNNQGNQRCQNWNMPTNAMAALAWNNLFSSFADAMNNQNNSQTAQNQNVSQQSSNVQPQQQTKNRISSVRIIGSPDDIKADEIPMDDSISLFMQDDLSVIYGKRWTNNGVVENLRFVLEGSDDRNPVETHADNLNSEDNSNPGFALEDIANMVSKLMDEKLDQFKKEYSIDKKGSGKTNSNNKKGVEENGE